MNQTDKPYQLTFTKERVIEFNSISDYDGYLVRTWKHFKSASDFIKYIQDLNFPENQQISVLSNEKGMVQILTIPSDLEAPKEKKFKRTNRNNTSISPGGDMGFLQYVSFGILAILLSFLIYQLFVKASFDDKGSKIVDDFEELAPTQIPKSELELLIEKALANDDFRGAIRLYFIFIIKGLSEKGWIRWEKKKTNFSYLIEMRGKPQYESFNDVVSIYELVWYGNYSVQKEDFNSLEPRFKSLLNNLNSGSK